jgi:hypothetical protein
MVCLTKMTVARSIMALNDQSNTKCKDVERSSVDWCKVISWRNRVSIKLCEAGLYLSILNTKEAAVLATGPGPRIINDIPRKCVAFC